MAEKTIGKKNGRIHFEVDIEFPEMKEAAMDMLSFMKNAADEMMDAGKRIVSKQNDEKKDIKKINIK